MTEELTEVTTVEAVAQTPEEKKKEMQEKHKKLQGEKQTNKKKVRLYNKAEAMDEINRLERSGHRQSKYYKDVAEKIQSFVQ